MDFDFKGRCTCKLLTLEPQVAIEEHEEIDKSCFSSSHVEGDAVLHKTVNALWILGTCHRQLDATLRLQLLNGVDAHTQAVCL